MASRIIRVSRIVQVCEDCIYAAVGAVLVLSAAVLLGSALLNFVSSIGHEPQVSTLQMLDTLLLVLMLVEILHTVGISIREHTVVVEPFLIVGLIAAIRRVLVITAEQPRFISDPAVFQRLLLELALLAVLILVLVVAIYLVGKRSRQP